MVVSSSLPEPPAQGRGRWERNGLYFLALTCGPASPKHLASGMCWACREVLRLGVGSPRGCRRSLELQALVPR